MIRPRRLLGAAARHAAAYGELLEAVWHELSASLARRALLGVLAFIFAISGVVVMSMAAVIAATEDNRVLASVLVGAAWLVASAVCIALASRASEPGPHRRRLADEIARDRELIREWRQKD